MGGGIDQHVVVVAGVGPGLGTAVVCLLASEGATVVAVARRPEAIAPIVEYGRPKGWKVIPRTADVRDPSEAERLVRATIDELGRIDALSLNVGRWIPGETLLHRMTPEEWSDGLRENLDAVYRVGRLVLPAMVERRHGSIVFVSAATAVRYAGSASYCAAKGGLADLVPKLARDYRAWDVRFNAVLPGSMSHDTHGFEPPTADRAIPLSDRTDTSPWEVARAIRYLVSDESRWVTGSLVTVDGGASTGAPGP